MKELLGLIADVNPNEIAAHIADTVDVITIIKPIYNYKVSE